MTPKPRSPDGGDCVQKRCAAESQLGDKRKRKGNHTSGHWQITN
jgi:hypothetical protein